MRNTYPDEDTEEHRDTQIQETLDFSHLLHFTEF